MQKKAEHVAQPAQPAQPAQDSPWHERGELPPVGCECEAFVVDENKWMHFEVIAIRDGHALGWCRESSFGFQSNDKSGFRPLSPLSPLSAEREKAIEEMGAALMNRGSAISDAILGELYDAGFRISLDK